MPTTSDTKIPTPEGIAGSAQTSDTRSSPLSLCPPLSTTRTSERTPRDLAPSERDPENPGAARRRPTTYVASSSEELLQNREEPGPRNATPGPSNVPAPAANDREILARYSWSHEYPPPLQRTSSAAAACGTEPTSSRGWNIPVPSPYSSTNSSRAYHSSTSPVPTPIPAPTSQLNPFPLPPNNDDPLPFANEGEDSDPPVRIRRGSDPLNPHSPDYDWPNLSTSTGEIFGPERGPSVGTQAARRRRKTGGTRQTFPTQTIHGPIPRHPPRRSPGRD